MEDNYENQIDLTEIFRALLRRLPFIAAVTVAFGLAAYIYSQWLMPEVYSTNVKLYVNNQQGVSESAKVQSTDVATSNTLVYGYVAMMKTDRVLEAVAMNTGLDYTTSQLSSMISAAGVDETPLFVVTVRSRIPEDAQTIANVVADVAPAVIQEVVKGSSAEIVDRAKLPKTPISPNVWRVTLIGLAVGLLLSVAAALLAEKFDLRIKNPAALTRRFGLPVLATVAGGSGYETLKNGVKFSFTGHGCRRVAVTDAGDGAGKGAVASGLALSLAEDGKRVLFVDADLGSGGAGLPDQLRAVPGLSNVLVGEAAAEAALRKNALPGLDALCAGDVPPVPTELLGCGEMRTLMESLAEKYDYIVLSAPSLLSGAEGAVLSGLSDGVIAVARGGRTAADKMETAVKSAAEAGVRNLGFVYNAEKKPATRRHD